MNRENILVKDYMRLSLVFVRENDTLFDALETMKKFQIDNISVIKDDFSVTGYLDKKKIIEVLKMNPQNSINLLRNQKIKEILKKFETSLVIYPRMTIKEAYSTMRCFNFKGLPVVDLPWEKKIIGFLWLDDIASIIEKNYEKVPV